MPSPITPPAGRPSIRGALLAVATLTVALPTVVFDVQAQSRKTEVAIRGDGFLINGRPTYAGPDLAGHEDRGPADEQPHGAGDLRRPEPRDPRHVGLPRHRHVGPRAQHPRVPRRHARVAAARPARLHHQPARRQPRGLLEGPALAQLAPSPPTARCGRSIMDRLEAHPRPRRRAGDGRHPRAVLLRPGRAAGGRGGRRCAPSTTPSTGCSTAATATS